jgi:hypothetical protein
MHSFHTVQTEVDRNHFELLEPPLPPLELLLPPLELLLPPLELLLPPLELLLPPLELLLPPLELLLLLLVVDRQLLSALDPPKSHLLQHPGSTLEVEQVLSHILPRYQLNYHPPPQHIPKDFPLLSLSVSR